MADTQTSVVTLDIQMLDESRSDTTTIKLDNPKSGMTRERVSSAMQVAFTEGWFLTNKGNVAKYLGDVTINQSIKTKLGGEDFYVTPSNINKTVDINTGTTLTDTITVSGATIQGITITDIDDPGNSLRFYAPTIADNGLSAEISYTPLGSADDTPANFKIKLVILGTEVFIPCTITVR